LSIYFFGLQQTKKGVKTKTKLESWMLRTCKPLKSSREN
jgi:hypothetical protein